MAIGPGKYDDAASKAREETKARGVALIVIGGEHGHGFSIQMEAGDLVVVPDMLENMARDIRKDLAAPMRRPD